MKGELCATPALGSTIKYSGTAIDTIRMSGLFLPATSVESTAAVEAGCLR